MGRMTKSVLKAVSMAIVIACALGFSALAVQAFQGKVVDSGLTTVTLQWDAAPAGFQGYYKIWRATVGASGNLSAATVVYTSTNLGTTEWTDTGAQQGTKYQYTVQLYSASDQLSATTTISACTLQKVSAINWAYVGIGAFLFVILVLLAYFQVLTALVANPAGIAAVVGLVIAATALVYVGATATNITALAGC